MTRLERLEVLHFRGIVDGSLPFNGGSVVLGGANGTGKTAFVDALDFFYKGTIATLAGTAGLGVRQHGAHIASDPETARVTARFRDPDSVAIRWLSGRVESPAVLDSHIARGGTIAFILRRAQLRQFIHAKPADRYRSIAELIGLERLDAMGAVMQRAHGTLKGDAEAAESELRRQQEAHVEANEPASEDEILAQLNQSLEDAGFGEHRLASLGAIQTVRSSLVRDSARPALEPRERARADLASLLAASELTRLREALAGYIEHGPSARDVRAASEQLGMLELLRRGREALRRHPETHHCPLCESEMDTRALLADLMRRIGRLEEVSLLRDRMERVRDDLTASLADASVSVRRARGLAREAGVDEAAAETLADALTMMSESLGADAPAQTAEMAGRLERALDRWTTWAAEQARSRSAEEDGAPERARAERLDAALAALERAAVLQDNARRVVDEAVRREARREALTETVARRRHASALAGTVVSTFTRVRNEEIQRLLDDLQADLVRLYDRLHPSEGYRALSIAMDPRKRASADLRLDFFDRADQDPRAFASEGHLDSLGICIFLAFVRRFNGAWPLLVLDDVVSSVDAPHKARVARLLFEEFPDRQLFITTHDGRWFNELRAAQAELGIESVNNLVIEGWTLASGPSIRPANRPAAAGG